MVLPLPPSVPPRYQSAESPALSRLPAFAGLLAAREPVRTEDSDRPRAAVAVVLAPDPDSILLIRRADREGDRWSGQLAFPGGRWGAGDPDLLATATRETREEVGLELSPGVLIGSLDDLAPSTAVLPPILVRPFVFSIPSREPLVLNPEVALAWWQPLEPLLQPGALQPVEFGRHGTLVRTMGFHLDQGVLWGMSERILRPMLGMLASSH